MVEEEDGYRHQGGSRLFFALCLVSWLGPKANLKLCSGKSRHFLKVFLLRQKYGWTFSKQYFRSCAQLIKTKRKGLTFHERPHNGWCCCFSNMEVTLQEKIECTISWPPWRGGHRRQHAAAPPQPHLWNAIKVQGAFDDAKHHLGSPYTHRFFGRGVKWPSSHKTALFMGAILASLSAG